MMPMIQAHISMYMYQKPPTYLLTYILNQLTLNYYDIITIIKPYDKYSIHQRVKYYNAQ
jgi:hypothetical protein